MSTRPKKRRKLADAGASTIANGGTVGPALAHLTPQGRSTLRSRKFIDEFQACPDDFLTLARVEISLVSSYYLLVL